MLNRSGKPYSLLKNGVFLFLIDFLVKFKHKIFDQERY